VLTTFWLGAVALVHTALLFPVAVAFRGRFLARPYRIEPVTPSVSIVVAAHNEEADLPDKLVNLLASEYPADRVEIIVASDGSSDRTVELARAVAPDRITVLDLPRTGKAGALNSAIAEATGEIVVFTDANSMLDPGSLQALIAPFADDQVGGVAGNQVYTRPDAGAVDGELAHWSVDRMLKVAASRSGSVVSATGALYAVRRELLDPVIDGVTDDFYVSTGVVVRHRRLVFAPDAVAREPVSVSADDEWARKRRVMTRGFRSVIARRELLDPRRHGWYSLDLFTYKVLRRLIALPVVAVWLGAVGLRRRHPVYLALALAGAAFAALAGAGYVLRDRPAGRHRALAIPTFVGMGFVASTRALLDVMCGREITHWTPARPDADTTDAPGVAAGSS
jgi:glycosyltransferase involved in cell wall biosynthesis